jgi:hypothetical protein
MLDAPSDLRELGFGTGTNADVTLPAGNEANFYDDVACVGTEASLKDCPRAGAHNCGLTEGVKLTCTGKVSANVMMTCDTDAVAAASLFSSTILISRYHAKVGDKYYRGKIISMQLPTGGFCKMDATNGNKITCAEGSQDSAVTDNKFTTVVYDLKTNKMQQIVQNTE